jgi:PAS domain S-box-containing protein
MPAIISWIEQTVGAIPLPVLEVWGRFAYLVGLGLAICAFGRFTFRIGSRWGLGRERQTWDERALLAIPLTFMLIVVSGYAGSFIVLVPEAQTFESLKDLVVILCLVLFGYPALITVPFAYGLSDLIEGIPPAFLLGWLPGYFINPACFWVAYQLIGREPDFRRARTWPRYLLAAAVFMGLEPALWGFICSDQFTATVSYRTVTPALFFTTVISWLLAPLAMLAALPLARRLKLFWAEIPGHVRERALGSGTWIWEAGWDAPPNGESHEPRGLPIRMFLLAPFIALVLVMVGVTAYVALRSAEEDATRLAARLHRETAANIRERLNDHLANRTPQTGAASSDGLIDLMKRLPMAAEGLAFIIDRTGAMLASSAAENDSVVVEMIAALRRATGGLAAFSLDQQLQVDHVTTKPLSRQRWLTYASAYPFGHVGRDDDWILVTAMPETSYLAGVQTGHSRSAMVFAVALLAALGLAAAMGSTVTAPLRRISQAIGGFERGELTQRVPDSRLEELSILSRSFNDMAARLQASFIERRQAEEVLKDHSRLLDLSHDTIFVWRADNGVITFWNRSAEELYGWTRQEAVGKTTVDLLKTVFPQPLSAIHRRLAETGRWEGELIHTTRAGTQVVVTSRWSLQADVEGRPARILETNNDISARRRVEDMARKARDELAHAARLATIGELAASIAHEVNQPLAGVVTNASACLRWLAKDVPNLDEARAAVQRIARDGQRASDVVERVRAMARKAATAREPLDINETVRGVVMVAEGELRKHGVALTARYADDLPPVTGDRVQLQQVVLNLMMNGIEAMAAIADRPRELMISTARDGEQVRVSVRDFGTGVPPEAMSRMFDAFYTTKPSGLGMGLSISRSIIEDHGGRLWATAGEGAGTTFHFAI